MSPEKQRIAIAKACGEDNDSIVRELIPDYLNDLNAMHEAEKVLIDQRMVTAYVTCLCSLCERAMPMQMLWHATATQRAEVFLRTIGKWEGAK